MNPYDLTVIRVVRTVVRVSHRDDDWQNGQVVQEQLLEAQVIDTKVA